MQPTMNTSTPPTMITPAMLGNASITAIQAAQSQSTIADTEQVYVVLSASPLEMVSKRVGVLDMDGDRLVKRLKTYTVPAATKTQLGYLVVSSIITVRQIVDPDKGGRTETQDMHVAKAVAESIVSEHANQFVLVGPGSGVGLIMVPMTKDLAAILKNGSSGLVSAEAVKKLYPSEVSTILAQVEAACKGHIRYAQENFNGKRRTTEQQHLFARHWFSETEYARLSWSNTGGSVSAATKPCVACAEEIKSAAAKCKHCGHVQSEPVGRVTPAPLANALGKN